MQYNLRGVTPTKIADLNVFLSGTKIKIISLNEHWLDKDSINVLNTVNNFTLGDYCLRTSGSRGGSCLLVEKGCKFVSRRDFTNLNEDLVFECSCVELLDLNVLVLSIYTIPNYNVKKLFFNKFEKMFLVLKK